MVSKHRIFRALNHGDENQTDGGARRRSQKSVDISKNSGLLCDRRAKELGRPGRGHCPVSGMRSDDVLVGRQSIDHHWRQAVDVEPDQVRMDLLSNADERLHEGCADFAAEETAQLQQASDRQGIGR